MLDKFICVLGYADGHFAERPIMLTCGHCACYTCYQIFKENTSLKAVKCQSCKKLNYLDIEYTESVLIQNIIETNLNKFYNYLKFQFEENLNSFKSTISID